MTHHNTPPSPVDGPPRHSMGLGTVTVPPSTQERGTGHRSLCTIRHNPPAYERGKRLWAEALVDIPVSDRKDKP